MRNINIFSNTGKKNKSTKKTIKIINIKKIQKYTQYKKNTNIQNKKMQPI
jgi:hypothetical protein